jgi:hypothetical protein
MSIAEDERLAGQVSNPAIRLACPKEGDASPPAGWPDGTTPLYPNVASWVDRWLCPNMEREITRTVEWCPMWWDHPEAVERLEALWEAWELGRIGGGTWKSTWWVTHADRHLPRLCHPDTGPFGHCHTKHRRDTRAWTSEPIPAEWIFRRPPTASRTSAPDPAMREAERVDG